MRWIMIIPVLLIVAILFATAPVLAGGLDEFRGFDNPASVLPRPVAAVPPSTIVTVQPAETRLLVNIRLR